MPSKARSYIIVVVAIVFATIIVAALTVPRLEIGSLAAIVGALGTSAGFVIAALVYRDARGERRRSQAEQVAHWYRHDEGPAPLGAVFVVVRNLSELPVFDVRYSYTHGNMPSVRIAKNLPPSGLVESQLTFQAPDIDDVVVLHFRDTSDRRWRRAPNGLLSEDTHQV